MKYRRVFEQGGHYFFTLVALNREPILVQNVHLLRTSFRYVKSLHHFDLDAAVILPDHLHVVMKLPDGDANYPLRWQLFKKQVNRSLGHNIWQKRYFEHWLRDDHDWQRHVDYIHCNPVKHGYCQKVSDWPHSSYRKYYGDQVVEISDIDLNLE